MPKIYTKTGDKGQTGLFGGARVPKDHPRVQAYGDVDELNSCVGAALASLDSDVGAMLSPGLEKIQSELFMIGALLATPKDQLARLAGPFVGGLPKDAAARLESEIDDLTRNIKPMDKFILPGGGSSGSWLHVARAVCRRAERSVVALSTREEFPQDILVYLNRLSDYLFTAARWVNAKQGRAETPWEGLTAR